MFIAKSENLSNLGGPMGSEYTTTNWLRHFNTLEAAKEYCVKDYHKWRKGIPIKWSSRHGKTSSGDLGFVMYEIREVETED